VRRKRDAQCFNSEEWDRWYYFEVCECTEEDWECDYGFSRTGDGACLAESGNEEVKYTPPEQCDGYYYVTQGYRKVSGDTCRGGVNHDPLKIPCPGLSSLSRSNLFILGALLLIILGLILATNNTVSSKFRDWKDSAVGMFSSGSKEKKYGKLPKEKGSGEDTDVNQWIFDNEPEDSAEPIEDKSLVEMGKGKKKMTSGNALELASRKVPTLNKPKGEDTNLIEFNPRS